MGKINNFLKERIPVNPETLKEFSSEPVPEHLKHWWWCLGGTAAHLFFVQLVTGILLGFYYVPSIDKAYESVQFINNSVPYGWYIRSIHRWSSNFMVVAVVLHLLRVFFTGAYRRPREINWMVGFGLLGMTLMFCFTGYSLVYEQLSYWGATVAGNITESVPIVGKYLANFIRGGDKVGAPTLTRFFVFHIAIIPTITFTLLFSHFALIRLHGVTEYEFEGSKSNSKKTFPFFPDHFITELGIGVFLMFIMTILAIVFPVGLEDKANPFVTPPHIKPEWYFYFTFRWLKLTSLHVAVITLGFGGALVALWPFIDSFFRKNNKKSEISILVGVLAFIAVAVLTLLEVLSTH